jgi:hypothetical protein
MEPEKDIFYKLVEKAKTATLTDRERSKLFMTVDAYVERNPIKIKANQASAVPNAVEKNSTNFFSTKAIKSPFTPHFSFSSLSFDFLNFQNFQAHGVRVAAVFAVVLVFGAGTSFAAQGSLPGDFLYPIKVNVNENVKSAFLFGIKDSEYEVARAVARVEEVKKLVAQNRLSPEIETKITARLNSHIAKVEKDVEELSTKGKLTSAFKISNDLQNSLTDSEIAISKIAKTEESVAQVAVAENIIRQPQKSSSTVRENTEEKIYTRQPNDEDSKTIALAKLDSVKKTLNVINEKKAVLAVSSASTLVNATRAVDVTTEASMAKSEPSAMMATFSSADTETKEVSETDSLATSSNLDVTATDIADISTDDSVTDEIDPRIVQINKLIAEGEEKFANNEFNEAFRLFREADKLAETIKSEMEEMELDDMTNFISFEGVLGEEMTVKNAGVDSTDTAKLKAEGNSNSANVLKAVENQNSKPVEKITR